MLIEALSRFFGEQEPVDGFSAKKLREYYLLNHLEQEERRYKLLLTQTDKKSLISVLDQTEWPSDPSLMVKQNFEFFCEKIKHLDDITILCKGLEQLIIVDIALKQKEDKPQLIFESMNSTGLDLSQADLIRNFILMGLSQEEQKKIYLQFWRPMEEAFGQTFYKEEFDIFIRDYLTMKTKEIPNQKAVYKNFKKFALHSIQNKETNALISEIKTFSDYYVKISLDKETNTNLKRAFKRLKDLKVNVSYPLLLAIYDDYQKKLITEKDFVYILHLIENYVFRRAICEIPTNSLNKTFAALYQHINQENYVESFQAYLLLEFSYRRFPKDDEFSKKIKTKDLYNFRSKKYYLTKLENYNRKEWVNVNEYTVEHILPQNNNLSQKWKDALGSDWKRVQEQYLHSLGNLTLTGYNSEYSDAFFLKKLTMKGGFKESPLRLNEDLKNLTTWNEETIKARSNNLAEKSLKIWFAPQIEPSTLEKYRHQKLQKKEREYSIEDYKPFINNSSIKKLFEDFSKQVLSLDPCVTQEFLKHYIAFKAEGNFLCINPQKTRLLLFLNLPIHELDDPKQLVSLINVGHWGTGDSQIYLKSKEEIPYVLELVKQCLEEQITY